MPRLNVERNEWITLCTVVLLGWTYWLIWHPYGGIYHDARIYSLLALHWGNPSHYAKDLFFLFGSQDDYNTFSPVFWGLIRLLGIDKTNYSIALIGGAVWVLAVAIFSRLMLGKGWAWVFAVLILSTIETSYSLNQNTFKLNENFATSRVITMSLVLLGLACWLMGRWGKAAVFLILPLMLHPLLGVWGIVTALGQKLTERRIAILIPAATLGILLMGTQDLHPALAVMQADWVNSVRNSSLDVFAGYWGVLRLENILFFLGLLLLGGHYGRECNVRWYRITALITAWAILASVICSYFIPIALVMQIQAWRVLWLAIVLAVIAGIDAVTVLWQQRPYRYWVLLSVIVSITWVEIAVWVVWFSFLGGCFQKRIDWLSFARAWMGFGKVQWVLFGGVVALSLPGYWLSLQMAGTERILDGVSLPLVLKGLLLGGGGGVFFGVLAFTLAKVRKYKFIVMVGVGLTVPMAFAGWEIRSRSTQNAEANYASPQDGLNTFRERIKPGEVVAWPNHALDVWFSLGTANYASSEQAIGIVFSYAKTELAWKRQSRLAIASMLSSDQESPGKALIRYQAKLIKNKSDIENIHHYGNRNLTSTGARWLCQDSALDWVVINDPIYVEGKAAPQQVKASVGSGTYYLYRCQDIAIQRVTVE